MFCEVEFLPVGEASKAGDAIVIRYGTEQDYRLMLVDGGHAETGERVVAHIRRQFGQQAVLDHVVLSHSDADHASGLRTVLEQVTVRNLWLHVPWMSVDTTLYKNRRWQAENLSDQIRGEYDIISEILDLGFKAGCKAHQPFQGQSIGPFRVLSPSLAHYSYLVPQFDRTPDPDQDAIEQAGLWIGKESLTNKAFEMARAAVQGWTEERWDRERLRDGGITSASNESSVVLYGDFGDGRRVLLTGDAGTRALTWAADEADRLGLPLQQFSFVQIPHHGSRRNVGPSILTRILGAPRVEGLGSVFSAFVSSPRVEDHHPRLIVLNAFRRRGGRVIKTNGTGRIHLGGFARRPGYTSVTEVPFSTRVEAYD